MDSGVADSTSLFVVTGPMAAGKSTVGELLAASFVRGVHLEGDIFRRFIVSGRQEMTREPIPRRFGNCASGTGSQRLLLGSTLDAVSRLL